MRYRGYTISYDPPPIPCRKFDWTFCHKDYDGPEDNRCGVAANISECFAEIDELEGGEACVVCKGEEVITGTETYTEEFGNPATMVTKEIEVKCPACNGTGTQ